MKRWIVLLLCGVIGVSMVQWEGNVEAAADLGPVIGSPQLAVLVDGRKVKFQGGDPVMENNRVQVPLRGIGEALGAKVDFSDKTVTYLKGEKSIVLTLGSKVAVVDGQNVTMDTAAKAVKGRTYVPLRFVSENLGESVSWDQVGNWVWIGSKEIPTPEEIGIKPQELDKFKKMIDPISGLYNDGQEDAYVFNYDQLPLKVGDRVIYDIWKIRQNGIDGLRVRYSAAFSRIYYLSSDTQGARIRGPIEAMRINDSYQTYIENYRIDQRRDDVSINDKNYAQFTIKKADYIGFSGLSRKSLFLLENPFK
ncbi:copper amine oxidase N-terminal domain-containing protein [Paenibacillus ihumii]|uniref:copper amine oxidase N-terminal domain-containing protein n=1 Tax=Paenibacillus ihumii TaxID=687436 RepID=UPI0006D84775|nr:copper amine oxidase N-terminal domain-containing protein [Paenibacillus ihumii]